MAKYISGRLIIVFLMTYIVKYLHFAYFHIKSYTIYKSVQYL